MMAGEGARRVKDAPGALIVVRAAWLLNILLLLGHGTRAAAPDAAQMQLTLLSPRNGTHIALRVPWFIEVLVVGAARGARLHFAFHNYAEQLAGQQFSPLVEDGYHKFLQNAVPSSERVVLLEVHAFATSEPHSVILATAWVSFRSPDLAIFYPMNAEPAIIAPGRPLVVNFGLVVCVMAVPGLWFRV